MTSKDALCPRQPLQELLASACGGGGLCAAGCLSSSAVTAAALLPIEDRTQLMHTNSPLHASFSQFLLSVIKI